MQITLKCYLHICLVLLLKFVLILKTCKYKKNYYSFGFPPLSVNSNSTSVFIFLFFSKNFITPKIFFFSNPSFLLVLLGLLQFRQRKDLKAHEVLNSDDLLFVEFHYLINQTYCYEKFFNLPKN